MLGQDQERVSDRLTGAAVFWGVGLAVFRLLGYREEVLQTYITLPLMVHAVWFLVDAVGAVVDAMRRRISGRTRSW